MQPDALSLGDTAELHISLDTTTIQMTGEITEFVESSNGLYVIINPGPDRDTVAGHIDNVRRR